MKKHLPYVLDGALCVPDAAVPRDELCRWDRQPVGDSSAAAGSRGAHASPRAGQAVALKAKLNPGRQPWQAVRCTPCALLCRESGAGRWKERRLQRAEHRERSPSLAIYQFALLAQVLAVCFCTPSWLPGTVIHRACLCCQKKARVFVACSVCPAE